MKSSKNEKEYSIGAYLKSQREKKGLSLQQIHEKTRIRPEVLENIESGENLPAPAYLMGFLKIYVRALDLDEVKFLREFYKKNPIKTSSPEKNSMKQPSLLFLRQELFLAISVALLVLASFFVFKGFRVKQVSQEKEKSVHQENQIKKKHAKVSEKPIVKTEGLIGEIRQGVYTKTLVIQSLEDTIMYFKTDGRGTVTKSLQKNAWYIIKARNKIYIRVDGQSYLNFIYEGRLFSVSSKTNFERIF